MAVQPATGVHTRRRRCLCGGRFVVGAVRCRDAVRLLALRHRRRLRARGRQAGVRRTGDHLDGRDESIPLARNGLDERGSIRRIAQSLPDLADRGVDAGLDVDEHVLAPQSIDDVATGDELTSTLDQQDQEVHRLPPEFDRAALPAQLVRARHRARSRGSGRSRADWTSASEVIESLYSVTSPASSSTWRSRKIPAFLKVLTMVRRRGTRRG